MNIIHGDKIRLIGLALKGKTTNEKGQSGIDCGNLWQQFEKETIADKIEGKIGDEILAVYHTYEGDHTEPFSYFIGCKVTGDAIAPPGTDILEIPASVYQKLTTKGKMPDCVVNIWKEVWASNIPRSYQFDYEIYGDKSKDWNNAEVDLLLSVHQ